MKDAVMRARHLLLAVCVTSCLVVACGDDDDSSPGGKGDAAGEAGAAGKAGGGGSPTNGGTDSKGGGGEGNPVGAAGEPGAAGMMNQGAQAGAGGAAPSDFVAFVHDLVENQTLETNQPAPTDQQFTEPQDDHGHYLVPESAFDDLF